MKRRGFLQCLGLLGAASVVPAPMARGIAQLITAGVVRPPLSLLVTGGKLTEESVAVFMRFAAGQSVLVDIDQCVVLPINAVDVRWLP